MIQEAVPSDVKELLEKQHLNGVPVLLSTTSDLSLSGDMRGHRVVVTRENLAVVCRRRRAPPGQSLAAFIASRNSAPTVRSARDFCKPTSTRRGSMLPRYSNTLTTRFHLLAEKLEDLRKSGEVTVHPEEEQDKHHCPRCGLRLAAAGESCPRCLPRKAIAAGSGLWCARSGRRALGDVLDDAGRRGHGTRPAEASAVSRRRNPRSRRSRAQCGNRW